MTIPGIYKIQSIIKPERIYIGSAVNIDLRWGGHLCLLRRDKHPNKILQNHYNKYGESDLQFSVLLGCPKEDLIKTEQYFIDLYNPHFNICKTAGSNLGRVFSAEMKRKISLANKGKKRSKEVCMRHSKLLMGHRGWNKGKKMSSETKFKVSKSLIGNKRRKGKITPEEIKDKISKSLKGRIPWNKGKETSESTKQKLRKPQSIETRIKKSIAHTGVIFTEEHKRRISEANKGENNAMFGKHHSEEMRLRISNTLKNRHLLKLSNQNN